MCFITKAMLVHRKLHYVSKCNKLVQLVVQVQYHVNAIYSLEGGHTHIPTLQTKAISRNQVHGQHAPGLKNTIDQIEIYNFIANSTTNMKFNYNNIYKIAYYYTTLVEFHHVVVEGQCY